MGHRTTYHQRSHQTGTGGVGNAVDISANPTGIGKHLITQRQQFANMVARGQLRHHTAVVCMHINLAEQCMRQQPTLAVVEATPVSSQEVSIPRISINKGHNSGLVNISGAF